jgi:hypothetical protein
MKGSNVVLPILRNAIEAYYLDANRIFAVVVVAGPYGRRWKYDDAYVKRTDGVYRHLYQVDVSWDQSGLIEVDQIHHWHVYV